LPIVGRRLIGRKFWGNLGSLPNQEGAPCPLGGDGVLGGPWGFEKKHKRQICLKWLLLALSNHIRGKYPLELLTQIYKNRAITFFNTLRHYSSPDKDNRVAFLFLNVELFTHCFGVVVIAG
jgi:hypothetical protein